MTKSRLIAVCAVVTVILGLGAYYIWRSTFASNEPIATHALASDPSEYAATNRPAHSGTVAPLPRDGESLGSVYGLLVKRANAGDGDAAKRLFDDTSKCLHVQRLDAWFQKAAKDKDWILNNPQGFTGIGGDPASNRKRALDEIKVELDQIADARQLCASAPKNLNDGRIYQAALAAARAGDTKATACLLVAPYKSPPVSGQQGSEYANEVFALARNAVEGGDWNVALAMMYVYNGMPQDGFSSYVTSINPEKELEWSELVRLGAPSASLDAQHLDRRLALLKQSVSKSQVAAATAWAKQMYVKYFSGSGPVYPDSVPCDY